MYSKPVQVLACLMYLASAAVPYSRLHEKQSLGPVVDLGYAQARGVVDGQTRSFYGLRYAAPPVGDLRWRKPLAIEFVSTRNSTTLDSTRPGPQCIQGAPAWGASLGSNSDSSTGPMSGSEDCLLLDVIMPLTPKSDSLPVMVQIHGGGYIAGNSTSQDGHALVEFSRGDLVFVQIQYRLGAFGFLGGDAIKQDGDSNVGLLDQREALNWVQRHIAAFGGDPQKVTISGGSAGGGSVTAHLISQKDDMDMIPFRGAIAEYPFWQSYHNDTILNTQYRDILEASAVKDLVELRKVSTTQLAGAYNQSFYTGYAKGLYGYGDLYYGPYLDNKTLRYLPSQALSAGHWTKVPLFVDHDAFEGAVFTNASITTNVQSNQYLRTVFPRADSTFFGHLSQLYPGISPNGSYFAQAFFQSRSFETLSQAFGWSVSNTQFWRLQEEYGDFLINCPTYQLASAAVHAQSPVWKLIYNTGSFIHGATGPDLFTASSLTTNATRANIMKSYFLAFVLHLDPNADLGIANDSRPRFPQYSERLGSSHPVLQIDGGAIGVQSDPDASDHCKFWQDNGPDTGN